MAAETARRAAGGEFWRSAISPATEKQFMALVVDLAKALGYSVYHPYLSIRSERGWPDLAMCKEGRFLLAELKAEKGKITPAQETWIARLRSAGVEVHLWRPSDWDSIVEILRGQS